MIRLTSRVIPAVLVFGLSSCIEPQELFNSGRDGRVFNASTGRYEWEKGATSSRPKRGSEQSRVAAPTPASDDGRTYNLQKGKYE